jgi:hypothetical protein
MTADLNASEQTGVIHAQDFMQFRATTAVIELEVNNPAAVFCNDQLERPGNLVCSHPVILVHKDLGLNDSRQKKKQESC